MKHKYLTKRAPVDFRNLPRFRKSGYHRVLAMLAALVLLAACAPPAAPPVSRPTQGATPTPELAVTAPPATQAQPAGTSPTSTKAIPIFPSEITQEARVNTTPIPTPSEPGLQEMVLYARQDLAQRLGVDMDRIELVELEAVVWPDGSLGCPQPGMAYTQALVEGLRIRLSMDGVIYNYHSGRGGQPFLCEQTSLDSGKLVP